jgi:hypothetical protein
MPKLSNDEIRALCENELWQAAGDSADLADERTVAMDMYLGEPLGDEVEGRSQFRTREVQETVEWAMPSLMRLFADAENICLFEPVGPEDEEAAKQETEVVNHVFWRQNRGFYNLYGFIKDALLQKTGILKVWWDDTPEEEREEYNALNDWELAQLFDDDSDQEILEYETNPDGTHKITILTKKNDGRLRIEPTPPEEFGLDRDARSIYPEDANFVYHRTRLTKSQLVEQGYSRKEVEWLPTANDTLTMERDARRNLSDEQDRDQSDHWSMERVWITECYIRVDRDDDGIAELLKVTLAGADSAYTTGSTVLDVEEVDRQPFVVWSPVLLTHKFYGLSLADLVSDLEVIKTTLTRQILDNTYLANNGRMAVNERVNLDDLMTSRPGGVVRTIGEEPPANSMTPIPQQPIPPQTFELLGVLDAARQKRVGVGEEVGALDTSALANINTGVAAIAYDAARSKVELMARICAEIGLRPLFLRIHELLRKNSGKQVSIRLSGGWHQVDPQQWRERADMVPAVGIGRVSRERRLVALSDVLEKQITAVQGGGLNVIVGPQHMYRAISDYTKELGLEESLYWMDPAEAQPQEPGPDYQMMALEIQNKVAEAQQAKVMADAQKAQIEAQMKQQQMQADREEAGIKLQIQQSEARIEELQMALDMASEDHKRRLNVEIETREQERKDAEVRLKAAQANSSQQLDLYKAMLQAGTALTKEQMSMMGDAGVQGLAGPIAESENRLAEMLTSKVEALQQQVSGTAGELSAALIELREAQSAPKRIERDENGRIAAVDGRPVTRDSNGRLVGIG